MLEDVTHKIQRISSSFPHSAALAQALAHTHTQTHRVQPLPGPTHAHDSPQAFTYSRHSSTPNIRPFFRRYFFSFFFFLRVCEYKWG